MAEKRPEDQRPLEARTIEPNRRNSAKPRPLIAIVPPPPGGSIPQQTRWDRVIQRVSGVCLPGGSLRFFRVEAAPGLAAQQRVL